MGQSTGFWVQRSPKGGPDQGRWQTIAQESGPLTEDDAKALCQVMRADPVFSGTDYRVVEIREVPT